MQMSNQIYEIRMDVETWKKLYSNCFVLKLHE